MDNKLLGLEKYNLIFHPNNFFKEKYAGIKKISKEHKISSIISLLGPLLNPFELKAQLIGLGKQTWLGPMLDTAKQLGGIYLFAQSFVDGFYLDEITSLGPNQIVLLRGDKVQEFIWEPRDFDMQSGSLSDLAACGNNVQVFEDVLQNKTNLIKIQTLALNAAFAKVLIDFNFDRLEANYHEALTLIEQGLVYRHFLAFADFTK